MNALAFPAILVATPPARAQGRSATDADALAPVLEGRTIDGHMQRLADLRGRVVLVFHWSTACPICRDKMPELRANLAGWQGRPFTLLGVNHDRRFQDLAEYERLVAQAVPPSQRFASIWAGATGFTDSLGRPEHLPTTALINARGTLVERHVGRVPAETWDRIADLM